MCWINELKPRHINKTHPCGWIVMTISVGLTPKVLWLCIHQKCSKTAISSITTKFLEFFFDIYIMVGSCSMMNWQHRVKISENYTVWIVRYKHSNSPKLFFNSAKNRAAALHKLTFQWKNVENGGASLN